MEHGLIFYIQLYHDGIYLYIKDDSVLHRFHMVTSFLHFQIITFKTLKWTIKEQEILFSNHQVKKRLAPSNSLVLQNPTLIV